MAEQKTTKQTLKEVTTQKPNIVKIDYDTKHGDFAVKKTKKGYVVTVNNVIGDFGLNYLIQKDKGDTIAKTKNGYHVSFKVFASDLKVLALQILLGSDQYREFFNMCRLANGQTDHWNVLFCKKYKLEKGKMIKVSEEKPL